MPLLYIPIFFPLLLLLLSGPFCSLRSSAKLLFRENTRFSVKGAFQCLLNASRRDCAFHFFEEKMSTGQKKIAAHTIGARSHICEEVSFNLNWELNDNRGSRWPTSKWEIVWLYIYTIRATSNDIIEPLLVACIWILYRKNLDFIDLGRNYLCSFDLLTVLLYSTWPSFSHETFVSSPI